MKHEGALTPDEFLQMIENIEKSAEQSYKAILRKIELTSAKRRFVLPISSGSRERKQ